jgi:secreted PhoX family phosphatase
MIRSARFISRSGNAGTVLPTILLCGLLGACGGDGFHGVNLVAVQRVQPMITKGLWIANGTNVLEYVPSQLTVAGASAAVPHLMNNSGSFGAPQGVTFDAKGNLWVMDPEAKVNGAATPALLEFSPAQLAALGTTAAPDPIATITSTALNFPQQSVFDAQGNQWVTDHNNNTVLVFTAAQLALAGTNSVVPAVTITSADFNGPLGIAFDINGDLWIANNGGVPGANGCHERCGNDDRRVPGRPPADAPGNRRADARSDS